MAIRPVIVFTLYAEYSPPLLLTLPSDVALSTDRYDLSYPNLPEFNKTFPQFDLTSPDIRCGRSAYNPSPKTSTADVIAGATIGFHIGSNLPWSPRIQHPGPAQVYLAKVPNAVSVGDWNGDGEWFKIAYLGPTSDTTWALQNGVDVSRLRYFS